MSEGHIYVSHWRRIDEGYEGWMDRWPDRLVTGETFDEMRDALADICICEVGDGEPQFEFEPPFIEAVGWEHLFQDGWRRTYLHTNLELAKDAVVSDGGFCTRCKWAIGNRTKAPLKVRWDSEGMEPKSFVASAHFTARLPVVSEELLDILTTTERNSFEVREVETIPSARTRYYEIVPDLFVSEVAGKPFKPGGWHCRQCNRKLVSNANILGYGLPVISRDSIDAGSTMFFFGDPCNFDICFSADRWEKIKTTFRSAEITSTPIGLIDPSEIEESPPLQDYKW